MPPPAHLNIPCREFVLTREDVGRYSDLLVEAFPEVRFYESYSYRKEAPPHLSIYRSLRDYDGRSTEIVFSAANWVPEWKRHERTGEWILANEPGFTGEIRQGVEYYTKSRIVDNNKISLEYIYGGRVYFRCRKWAPEDLKAARKALRLLSKVATNKVALTLWPSDTQPYDIIPGDRYWCGYDALRWVVEHPDRRLGCWLAPGDDLRGYRPLGA